MTTLPIPRYTIGDQFWIVEISTKTSQLPCPDCKDTREWRVISPAGAEHSVACPRCSGGYSAITNVPPLKYIEHVGHATLFTVRGMDIRSHNFGDAGDDTRVSYYSSPHGGHVYHEHQAYDSEEAAQAVATLQAAALNAKTQATPEHLKKISFSRLELKEAALTAANESMFDAWWAYRFLKEDVEQAAENDGQGWGSIAELCEELIRFVSFDAEHRKQYRAPCPEPLFDALEQLVGVITLGTDCTEACENARKALKSYIDGRRPLSCGQETAQ